MHRSCCALGLLALAASATPGDARGEQAQRRAEVTQGVVTLRAPAEGRVMIRGGTFSMGSDVGEIGLALTLCRFEPARADCHLWEDDFAAEFPPHEVLLDDYFLDRVEVTYGDYTRCVEVGPCGPLPLASGGKRFESPELPASMVTWGDAAAYCKWRGGRLPTEAEWDRAARGVAGRRYPFGNTFDPFIVNGGRLALDALEDKDGFLELAPVGSFPNGRTPDGIHDLSGNVEEWVSDWFGAYPEANVTNPKGPETGDAKVIRGGHYAYGRAWLRGATRNKDLPSARRPWRGFRCAYDL